MQRFGARDQGVGLAGYTCFDVADSPPISVITEVDRLGFGDGCTDLISIREMWGMTWTVAPR